jgi:cobalt-zinc-cadmium efflux system protein
VLVRSVERLVNPHEVHGEIVAVVAAVGVVLNVAAVWALSRANRQSLNVEGSFQHLLTDLYAFLGTLAAGIVIATTGWNRADAAASLAVSLLMLRSAYGLLTSTASVVLESAPADLDPQLVGPAMCTVPAVRQVHDLHVWEIVPGEPLLSAHVLVGTDADCHAARRDLEALLATQFGITHTTLQVDHDHGGDLVQITPRG